MPDDAMVHCTDRPWVIGSDAGQKSGVGCDRGDE